MPPEVGIPVDGGVEVVVVVVEEEEEEEGEEPTRLQHG